MMNELTSVTAFAPATTSNLAVGFDILGFALDNLGDEVTLVKSHNKELAIVAIEGKETIPYDIDKNTATVALQAMLDYLQLEQGFDLYITKKIPLSSGLGGSAAGSVAAVVALNQFLLEPLSQKELVEFALLGEQAACGAKHGDNVIPSLFGGMTLIQSLMPLRIIHLPTMPIYAAFVHPHLQLDTRTSRAALKDEIELKTYVKQSAHLASFISALYENDYERLESSCRDELIEPMRAHLIPGFYEVKAQAYRYGALACSISGSGPTVFALAKSKESALIIAEQMVQEFKNKGIESDTFISGISTQGAYVNEQE